MDAFQGFYVALEQLVRSGQQRIAMQLFGLDGEVELLEGASTVEEALDYASLMYELGMDDVARDVLVAVVEARATLRETTEEVRITA